MTDPTVCRTCGGELVADEPIDGSSGGHVVRIPNRVSCDVDPAHDIRAPHEWRAVITCSADPCSYCRHPAAAVPLAIMATREEAVTHGRAMANNVYGASCHHVTLQHRPIHQWQDEEPT